MPSIKALALVALASTSVTAYLPTCIRNFTLTIDSPGFAADGYRIGHYAAGVFTNISTESSPTVFYKKNSFNATTADDGTMYANFPGGDGFQAQDWQFSVYNGTGVDEFAGRADLTIPLSQNQFGGVPATDYSGSFTVAGDDAGNPWRSDPHISFEPSDHIGNGSWWACPDTADSPTYWRIFGGVAGFNGNESGYPEEIPCIPVGSLKAEVVAETGCIL